MPRVQSPLTVTWIHYVKFLIVDKFAEYQQKFPVRARTGFLGWNPRHILEPLRKRHTEEDLIPKTHKKETRLWHQAEAL